MVIGCAGSRPGNSQHDVGPLDLGSYDVGREKKKRATKVVLDSYNPGYYVTESYNPGYYEEYKPILPPKATVPSAR